MRDMLAQASPLRLGEGSKGGSGKPRGISLRRDPSRLGETLARSKYTEQLAWADFRELGFG